MPGEREGWWSQREEKIWALCGFFLQADERSAGRLPLLSLQTRDEGEAAWSMGLSKAERPWAAVAADSPQEGVESIGGQKLKMEER